MQLATRLSRVSAHGNVFIQSGSRTSGSLGLTRHTVCKPSGLRRSLVAAVVVDDKSSEPPSIEAQSSENIVKKAWDELNQKSMSLGSVLGESNVARLEAQLGKEKMDQIAGGECCRSSMQLTTIMHQHGYYTYVVSQYLALLSPCCRFR